MRHVQEEEQHKNGLADVDKLEILQGDGANRQRQIRKESADRAWQQNQPPGTIPERMLGDGVEPAAKGFQYAIFTRMRQVMPAKRDHSRAQAVQQSRSCANERGSEP